MFDRHPGIGLAVSLVFVAIGAITLITDPHGYSPRTHRPNTPWSIAAIVFFGLCAIAFAVRLARRRG